MSLVFSLLGISLVLVSVYLSFNSLKKAKLYFFKGTELDKLEDKYDLLRTSYSELKQHYYWAESLGEKDKQARMKKEIFRVEDELDRIKEEFMQIQGGKTVPLKECCK